MYLSAAAHLTRRADDGKFPSAAEGSRHGSGGVPGGLRAGQRSPAGSMSRTETPAELRETRSVSAMRAGRRGGRAADVTDDTGAAHARRSRPAPPHGWALQSGTVRASTSTD